MMAKRYPPPGWRHIRTIPLDRVVEVLTVSGLVRWGRPAGAHAGTREALTVMPRYYHGHPVPAVLCWRQEPGHKSGDLIVVAWREV